MLPCAVALQTTVNAPGRRSLTPEEARCARSRAGDTRQRSPEVRKGQCTQL